MPVKFQPHEGHVQGLVLAIDIGTTFSGISYAFLKPKTVPEIQAVTRFPAQEHVGGDAKIPSVLYYDRKGNVKAVGAEAQLGENIEQAQRQDWIKAEWFKLHFRREDHITPSDVNRDMGSELPSLPPNKTAVDVFGDFLRYLYSCAKKYILGTVPDRCFWAKIEEHIQFVLSHPNCWEAQEQSLLKDACVKAGLIPDTLEGRNKVSLITEGEACLHFCINEAKSGIQSIVPDVKNLMVVDAGGGTVDISTYSVHTGRMRRINETSTFQEITIPKSRYVGSVLVTQNARAYLKDLLADSGFAKNLDRMTKEFDRSAKLRFSGSNPSYIEFAASDVNDEERNIQGGQLKLPGYVVQKFFEKSLTAITSSMGYLLQGAEREGHKIKAVFLVGGFASNEYLFKRLSELLRAQGVKLYRPHAHLNKATADGAVSYCLRSMVSARVARYTIGVPCSFEYNRNDCEHNKRKSTMTRWHSGQMCIPNGFAVLVSKGEKVTENQVHSDTYHDEALDRGELARTTTSLWVYKGQIANPTWMNVDADNFHSVCKIEADISQMSEALVPHLQLDGSYRYELRYNVEISLGTTELKANISWKEKVRFHVQLQRRVTYSHGPTSDRES
ncbi:hypothetical protein AAF712_009915 [Marasmius tenuissimus]|uniref:Uncharacterized protein n=1 Tax=Marasmius tenuissimus TaxID=585030 RepID=A0ABR2ZQ08_9AGAR